MPSFNGWEIITLPEFPAAPRSVEWKFDDAVSAAKSDFSYQQQAYDWGASRLRASLSYQPMNHDQAEPWIVFFMALRGVKNVFQFGDPMKTGPKNPAAVGGTVTGSGQTGYSLIASATDMTPGDWISLGLRLYRVTSVDGGTLGIWPQLRESPANGTEVVIANTKGLFRLTKNDRGVSVNHQKIYTVTFEIEEAL